MLNEYLIVCMCVCGGGGGGGVSGYAGDSCI